jgi:hypothetical protein
MVFPDSAIEHISFMPVRWVNVIGSQTVETGSFWAFHACSADWISFAGGRGFWWAGPSVWDCVAHRREELGGSQAGA